MTFTRNPLLCLCSVTIIIFYLHIINNFFTLNKDIRKYNTKSPSNVHTIQTGTNYQKHSVKYKGILVWNSLTKSIKDIKSIKGDRKVLTKILVA